MSKRIYHRLSALLLAVWMFLSLTLPAAGAAQMDTATITIASESDFLASLFFISPRVFSPL